MREIIGGTVDALPGKVESRARGDGRIEWSGGAAPYAHLRASEHEIAEPEARPVFPT